MLFKSFCQVGKKFLQNKQLFVAPRAYFSDPIEAVGRDKQSTPDTLN